MKSLLSMLAVSTLVGTSAGNLKRLFTNSVISHGFKSNQINNKDISIKNQNNTNPFINKIPTIDDNSNISSNVISSNGTIYLGTYNKGLWKSTDGIKFIKTTNEFNEFKSRFQKEKTKWEEHKKLINKEELKNYSFKPEKLTIKSLWQ